MARSISYIIHRRESFSEIPGIVPTTIVSLVLLLAWLSHAIGMAMVPRGEVGLIFSQLGLITGLFDAEIYTTVVPVIACTTLLTPFWLGLFYQRCGQLIAD